MIYELVFVFGVFRVKKDTSLKQIDTSIDKLLLSNFVLGEDAKEFLLFVGRRIKAYRTHRTQYLRTAAVLHGGNLTEVDETPVQFVTVNVVDFHAFFARSDESLPNEMMAEAVAEISHTRVHASSFVVLLTGVKTWFEFFTGGVVELAVRAREENLTFDALRRDLFDNRNNHKTSPIEGCGSLTVRACRSRIGGAKVEV